MPTADDVVPELAVHLTCTIHAMSVTPVLQPFYMGWATHQRRLLAAIADLGREQLALRPAPDQMTIWSFDTADQPSKLFM